MKGKIDFHSFRVTYITLILESGASIQYAQNLARHADPKLTFNVYGKTNDEQIRALTEATGGIILAQRENKKAVNSELSTTYEVAGPGLESKKANLSLLDKPSKIIDSTITHHTKIDALTNIIKTYIYENFGQFSDNEKQITDSFRAQYEHNEIPPDLVQVIKAWPKIPDSMAKGIVTMVECYI